jgi:hypothetical protein
MDKVLLRPIFRKKYLEQQKSQNRFRTGGLANIQKFQTGGLSVGERRAIRLQPFVSSLLGATQKPGESALGSVARAVGKGFERYPEALKTLAAIDKVGVDRLSAKQKAQQDLEKEFRNTFNKSKVVDDFQKAQAGYARVVAGGQANSKAGDIALIFGYMKTLDPNSVVRESEFSLAENVGSMSDYLKSFYSKFKGEGRLTPKMRQELLNASTQQFSTYQIELDTFKQDFRKQLREIGLDPKKIELVADRRPKEIQIGEEIIKVPLGTKLIKVDTDKKGGLVFIYQMPDGRTFPVGEQQFSE